VEVVGNKVFYIKKYIYIYSRFAETLKVNFRRTAALSKNKYYDISEGDSGDNLTERSDEGKRE